ncbi:MAG: cobalt ECF transporter T component CbiQ [Thermoleophilia bacterium]
MGGVHHFLTDPEYGNSFIHRLDPRTKLVGFLGLTIVSVSTPATEIWAFVVYAALLLFVLGVARLPVGYALRRMLVVLPFVLVVAVFIPFFDRSGPGSYSVAGVRVSAEGLLVLWNVTAKASLGVFSAVLLISTTSYPELIRGLEGLHVPRIFTEIASFMYRYAFLFLEEAGRMRRAMQARNYRGRWLWHTDAIGGLLSSLFLRSYSRGERVYVAMLSRGYEGSMPAAAPLRFGTADVLFVGCLGAALALTRAGAAL